MLTIRTFTWPWCFPPVHPFLRHQRPCCFPATSCSSFSLETAHQASYLADDNDTPSPSPTPLCQQMRLRHKHAWIAHITESSHKKHMHHTCLLNCWCVMRSKQNVKAYCLWMQICAGYTQAAVGVTELSYNPKNINHNCVVSVKKPIGSRTQSTEWIDDQVI